MVLRRTQQIREITTHDGFTDCKIYPWHASPFVVLAPITPQGVMPVHIRTVYFSVEPLVAALIAPCVLDPPLVKATAVITVTTRVRKTNEPQHDKSNKMTCAPSQDTDQTGHPFSLIRVFTVRMKKVWVLSYPLSAQRKL